MVKNVKLTTRQKKILNIIINSEEFITINKIAEQINVSSRTILREIASIENWLNAYSCELCKKTGFGLMIKGDREDLNRVKINITESKEEEIYTKYERKIILIAELLKLDEPIKIFYFTKKLYVTESTISIDLNSVEKWFKESGLKLIRKAGVGIYIEKNEELVRKATLRLLYENIDYKNILDLITDESQVIEKIVEERVLGIIDKKLIKDLKESLETVQENLFIELPDNIYISLLIHVALVIQRIRNKMELKIDCKYVDEIKFTDEYEIAKVLVERIEEDFNIKVANQEIAYIAKRLIGFKEYKSNVEEILEEGIKVDYLINDVMEQIEIETGEFLRGEESLCKELIVHLKVAIKRLKFAVAVRNPLLEEIKEQYESFYKIAEKVSRNIEKTLRVKIPEDEIGFIAIHIGSIIERKRGRKKKVCKAIIVCPTGIGASILLASKIKKNFSFIEIVDKVSVLNLKKIDLIENEIDLIISTVKLTGQKVKTIVVSSLLKEKDKELISETTKEIESKIRKTVKEKELDVLDLEFKNKMKDMKIYSEGIYSLLKNFTYSKEEIENIDQLIKVVVINLINKEIIDENKIIFDLKAREEKGSTVFEDEKVMLLHCRTEGISTLYFGVCNFKNEININNNYYQGALNGALIMLGPKTMNEKELEIMGSITTAFVENSDLLKNIIDGNENKSYNLLNNILKEFYESKN
ncbi:MAG: BglG family transcription antiterminator [Sarcina sp.]